MYVKILAVYKNGRINRVGLVFFVFKFQDKYKFFSVMLYFMNRSKKIFLIAIKMSNKIA